MSDAAPAAVSERPQTAPKSIYLVPFPKIIFLYPTFLAALAAAIYTAVAGPTGHGAEVAAIAFLGIFALNLVVLSFDFPRTASLTLFFLLFGVGMGLVLLFRTWPDVLPAVTDVLKRFRPLANATFYFTVAGTLGVIFSLVLVSRRFDYWEVRGNEILHHTGLLSDLKRYNATNLRIDKEIHDLFEYALLRSGTLILHPSTERQAIVLENVPGISRKEEQITRMLGTLKVQVRETN
jgi:hypothetical protein